MEAIAEGEDRIPFGYPKLQNAPSDLDALAICIDINGGIEQLTGRLDINMAMIETPEVIREITMIPCLGAEEHAIILNRHV